MLPHVFFLPAFFGHVFSFCNNFFVPNYLNPFTFCHYEIRVTGHSFRTIYITLITDDGVIMSLKNVTQNTK